MSYTSAFGGNYIDSFLSQTYATVASQEQQVMQLQNNINALRDIFYPVGTIYQSLSPTDPSTFIGGTWQRIAGVYLFAHDDHPDQGAGGVFGSWYHTHITGDCTLTIAQMPSHNHLQYLDHQNVGYSTDQFGAWFSPLVNTAQHLAGSYTYGNAKSMNNTGGSQPHNHGVTGEGLTQPPSYRVYMWQRVS